MAFVTNPNLPDGRVKVVVVDERISAESAESLVRLGVVPLRIKPHSSLYTSVCSHPDMLLHHIGGETVVYAPGTDPALIAGLTAYGFRLLQGETELTGSYPGDIAYNAARVGNFYFHNLKHTDPLVRKLLEKQGVEPVQVSQGYAKCSVLPLDDHSLITSDAGIAKVAERKGLDVLRVDLERSIRLPGLNYGFIGGACGMLGKSVCAVNGAVDRLSCHDEFVAFLSKKNIIPISLSGDKVTDIGSILALSLYDM